MSEIISDNASSNEALNEHPAEPGKQRRDAAISENDEADAAMPEDDATETTESIITDTATIARLMNKLLNGDKKLIALYQPKADGSLALLVTSLPPATTFPPRSASAADPKDEDYAPARVNNKRAPRKAPRKAPAAASQKTGRGAPRGRGKTVAKTAITKVDNKTGKAAKPRAPRKTTKKGAGAVAKAGPARGRGRPRKGKKAQDTTESLEGDPYAATAPDEGDMSASIEAEAFTGGDQSTDADAEADADADMADG